MEGAQMLEPTLQTHGLETGSGPHGRRAGGGADGLPDLLLIERARGADERAIEALIRRYSQRLFRVARSVVADDERAESAVQEAYLAAFADLSRYEPTGKFAAWLTRLTFNQARSLRASTRSGAAVSVAALTPGGAAAVETAAAETSAAVPEELHERLELEQAIAALPAVFRTVYVLRMIEGVSGIETAASLGVHETTVRTRLYRAHRRLTPDIAQRIRAATGLLQLPAHGTERIVSRVLRQLPQGSILTICASTP
jgi:RNA polymerase sigma-70 factor, ECF subfamily